MYPRVDHVLVDDLAQIQHEIRHDQHEHVELVALAGEASLRNFVRKPTESGARHQNVYITAVELVLREIVVDLLYYGLVALFALHFAQFAPVAH